MSKKYSFDEIIASAYYVFRDGLTTTIITNYFTNMKKLGISYNREETKFQELKRLVIFDGYNYGLAEGVYMQDIIPYVKDNLVMIFKEIEILRDNYYNNTGNLIKVKSRGKK